MHHLQAKGHVKERMNRILLEMLRTLSETQSKDHGAKLVHAIKKAYVRASVRTTSRNKRNYDKKGRSTVVRLSYSILVDRKQSNIT